MQTNSVLIPSAKNILMAANEMQDLESDWKDFRKFIAKTLQAKEENNIDKNGKPGTSLSN